jgi:hypothetical protein
MLLFLERFVNLFTQLGVGFRNCFEIFHCLKKYVHLHDISAYRIKSCTSCLRSQHFRGIVPEINIQIILYLELNDLPDVVLLVSVCELC